jgi:hypothetical protein
MLFFFFFFFFLTFQRKEQLWALGLLLAWEANHAPRPAAGGQGRPPRRCLPPICPQAPAAGQAPGHGECGSEPPGARPTRGALGAQDRAQGLHGALLGGGKLPEEGVHGRAALGGPGPITGPRFPTQCPATPGRPGCPHRVHGDSAGDTWQGLIRMARPGLRRGRVATQRPDPGRGCSQGGW